MKRRVGWIAAVAFGLAVGCSEAAPLQPQLSVAQSDGATGGDAGVGSGADATAEATEDATGGGDSQGRTADVVGPQDAEAVNDAALLGDEAQQVRVDTLDPADTGELTPDAAPPLPDVPPPPPDVPQLPPDVPPPPADVPQPPPDVPPPPPDVPPPPPDVPPPPPDVPNGPKCGNSVCESGESTQGCPADCKGGANTWTCGDSKCDIGEQFYCQQDCPGAVCGDGKCQLSESSQSCAKDCKSGSGGGNWVCGDKKCDIGEQFYCKQDCASDPTACIQGKCAAELQKCKAKPNCEKAVQCVSGCGGSWSCAQNCLPGGAQSNQEALAVLVCADGAGCL